MKSILIKKCNIQNLYYIIQLLIDNFWGSTSIIFCNSVTNDRGYRLLEFAKTNELKIVNTFGPHKKSRIQTWHSPGGIYHNQIDYILVSKRLSTSVNINKTRSFPGADIGSDHDMLMMTFSLHLKNTKKNKFTRNKFDLEKLKNPETKKLFEKKINEKLMEQKLTEIENTEEMLQKLKKNCDEIYCAPTAPKCYGIGKR